MTNDVGGFSIAPLAPGQVDQGWELRLRALREHPEAFGQPYAEAVRLGPAEVRERVSSFWFHGDNRVFVATRRDRTLVGMLGVARETRDRERHRAHIWGVYVAPEARARGLAGRLLSAAIDWCRSLDGVLQVHLGVEKGNEPAVRAYRTAGFTWCGRTPRVWILDGVGLDQDHMVLMLDDYPIDLSQAVKGSSS